jgi:hypothetical protein
MIKKEGKVKRKKQWKKLEKLRERELNSYNNIWLNEFIDGIRLKVKGKAFPLQAWTGLWGSRRLRLQNF